jgi:formylglycine-generating enzyme required for sulfatase activity
MLLRRLVLGLTAPAVLALALPHQNAMADPALDTKIEELKTKTAELVAAGRAALESRSSQERLSLPPVVWRVPGAVTEFKDCANCPEMAVVPAGEFTMGRPRPSWQQRRSTG